MHTIIAGHGNFASGLYSSVELILGEQDETTILDCYIDPNQDLKQDILKLYNEYINDDIVVFTDIQGGSVYNEFILNISENISVISGTNLPLLLEYYVQKNSGKLDFDTLLLNIKQTISRTTIDDLNNNIDEDF